MLSREGLKLRDTIYSPKILSLMPTWQCTAACTDCGTFSHPRNKIRLSFSDMISAIDGARDAGFELVVFTGGEATLRGRELLDAIRHAKKMGLATRLVTNAWWAKTTQSASARMTEFQAAQLDEINFSTGDEHAKFVPVNSVMNAIVAAIDCKFKPHVMIELRSNSTVTEALLKDLAARALPAAKLDEVHFAESPWMPLDFGEVADYPKSSYSNSSNLDSRSGCHSIFNTHTLQSNGMVAVCCGLGIRNLQQLQIEKFRSGFTSFQAIEQVAEADLMRLLVKRLGPERVLSKAAIIDPSIEWENRYAHQCQACVHVFQDPRVAAAIESDADNIIAELSVTIGTDLLLENAISDAVDRAD